MGSRLARFPTGVYANSTSTKIVIQDFYYKNQIVFAFSVANLAISGAEEPPLMEVSLYFALFHLCVTFFSNQEASANNRIPTIVNTVIAAKTPSAFKFPDILRL